MSRLERSRFSFLVLEEEQAPICSAFCLALEVWEEEVSLHSFSLMEGYPSREWYQAGLELGTVLGWSCLI